MSKLTGSNTHRANQPGYAFGQLIDTKKMVPAGVPISTVWMDEVEGSAALEKAVEEAQDAQPDDVDLTQMSKAALEAMAADHGINPGGLAKADLITAIKAAYDKNRTQ